MSHISATGMVGVLVGPTKEVIFFLGKAEVFLAETKVPRTVWASLCFRADLSAVVWRCLWVRKVRVLLKILQIDDMRSTVPTV